MAEKFDKKRRILSPLVGAFVVAAIFSGTFFYLDTKTANAQYQGISAALLVPTNDVPNNAKESWVDGLAWAAGNILIDNITNSVVRWINNGFRGGPGFVTNPGQFLTGVADQVAGEFIAGTELGFLCDPFELDIRAALNLDYSSDFRIGCTLSDVIANTEDFTKFTDGNFNQGGWDGWYSMTQNPNNNPYGAYAKSKSELSARIAGAQGIELLKLDWGNGFFSWEDEDGDIQTPGSVVETQLENVLGTNLDRLEIADEFNEIVGALASQFVSQLVGGLSSGGRGGGNDNPLSVYCFPSTDFAEINESVTWTAYVNGNRSSRATYVWSGSSPLDGGVSGTASTTASTTVATTSSNNAGTATLSYPTAGIKSASVRVSAGGRSRSANCSDTVTVGGTTL